MFHRTSDKDLEKLCKDINIHNVMICRKSEMPKYIKNKNYNNFIINLDDFGTGSHWVAFNKNKKIYFDSYSLPPPTILKKYVTKVASNSKELQTFDAEDCGPLCCLWLYFINYRTNKEYYNLFKDIYL